MLWHGGHVVVKGAIRFVTTAVLARLLLPKEFGVVGMALLVNEIVSLLGGFSLGVALIQKKDLDERYFDTTFWANLVVGMGLSLCFLVAAPIAAAFFKTPQVQPLVMFLALHYLIAAAGGVHKALLLRQLQFQRFAVLSVVSAVARSVVALALAFAGFGIWGIMMGLLAERITTLWMLLVMVPWRPRWHFAWRQFHDLFRFSRNLYGENLLRFFNANSDRFLTGRLLGASALGFYQFAYALPHLVVEYFTETVSEVLFPVYSKVQDDHARFRRGYTMTVTLTALVTFPLLVGLMVVAPELIRLAYGSRWSPVVLPLRVLCVSAAVMSVMHLTNAVLHSKGRPDVGFRWNLVMLPTSVAVLAAASRWGVEGIAVAMSALALFSVIPTLIACRLISLHPMAVVRALLPACTGAVIMGGTLHGLRRSLALVPWALPDPLFLVLAIGVGAMVYLASVRLLYKEAFEDVLAVARSLVSKQPAKLLRSMSSATRLRTPRPLVSVVIPTYRTPPRFLREAIDSVLKQSHRPLEVIVVDDGSTPRSEWLSQEYGDRVRYRWKPNGGVASARNVGIRMAQGDYVAFLDADDLWEPDKIATQLRLFDRHQEVGLVYARIAKMNHDGQAVDGPRRNPKYAGHIFRRLFLRNFIPASTAMIRRTCVETVGLFDESPGLFSVEDYDLWLRIAERYRAAFSDRVLATYRIHPGGISRNLDRSYQAERRLIDKTIRQFGTRHPELARLRRKRIARSFFEHGYDLFEQGRFAEARKQFGYSVRYRPLNLRTGLYLLSTFSPMMITAIRQLKGYGRRVMVQGP